MKIKQWVVVALTAIVGIYIHTANAALIFSVDLDPNTTVIESTRTVTEGDVFTVDFTVTGDGTTLFDQFIFDIIFNDAGAVLGSGPTGPLAGSIAVTAPFDAIDAFTLTPVIPGFSLSFGPPSPPPLGFANQSGQVGISSIGFLPFTGGPLSFGQTIDLFSLDFVASTVGTSTISANILPIVTGQNGFFDFFTPVIPSPFPIIARGQVTVQSATSVPEPSTILLFSLGILGLIGYARQQQKLTQ